MKRVNSVYVLHVSDFHVSKESEKDATDALAALTSKLQKENICISYLIHTGDIINSSDLEQEITQQYGSSVANDENAERYNELLKPLVSERFESATKIMKMFIGNLGVSNKNVIICCGNHDKVRFHNKEEETFSFFEKFLNNQEITVHKELTTCVVMV